MQNLLRLIFFVMIISITALTQPKITALKLTSFPPSIDGKLTEEIWQTAVPAKDFVQKIPDEGVATQQKTEVRFCYDDEALYIGARMFSEDPKEILAQVSRRDDAGSSERIIISLDTYFDHRTAYSFGITATGVRVDYYHSQDSEFRRDYAFDPVWEAQAQTDSTGWTAELRIPFSQLRFSKKDQQIWGINMNRWIPSITEDSYWILVPKDETGWSSRFGELVGISNIKPSRRLEILPYTAGDLTLNQDSDTENPFFEKNEGKARAGLDFKLGLGPNLTLDGTINPDFGQVEADPAVINLTAFETRLSERRPFFTEGRELLQGNGANYYYSRRIGARAHGSASGDYTNVPDNTTILGAGKITGRLNNGLSIGVLTAFTDQEFANSADVSGDTITHYPKTKVEPYTSYGVVRLQQEIGKNASTIGMILTGVNRSISLDEDLADVLNKEAYSGGMDWNLRLKDGEYELNGALGFSHISGSATKIHQVQESSAHYFQRPDADYVNLDSTQTKLNGYTVSLNFSRESGKHWLGTLATWAESPGFELNDLGRVQSADDRGVWAVLRYRENTPRGFYRDYSFNISGFNEWNFGGEKQENSYGAEGNITFNNFWRFGVDMNYSLPRQNDKLTRGGPLMKIRESIFIRAFLGNNFASNTRWSASVNYFSSKVGSNSTSVRGEISFRPGSRWSLTLNPSFSQNDYRRQYYTTIARGMGNSTYGNRYIFATLNQTILATGLRLNYAFTPDLTLEFYARPFATKGDYKDFGELVAEKDDQLNRYNSDEYLLTYNSDDYEYLITEQSNGDEFDFSNRDFNTRSFRSNLVLRWEWRPGSTFFLVWQQNKSPQNTIVENVSAPSLLNAISDSGDNFLAVKFSYWLPVN